jgi:hypothetical protein
MATFTSFSNILPDPNNKITDQGDIDSSGVAGPGFTGVGFTSNGSTQVSRTNSGRGVHRDQEVQYWSFSIKYNPMLREEFEPVDSFLASRNARKNPFFVILPQYSKPRDPLFATWCLSNIVRVNGAKAAGSSTLILDSIPAINGSPKSGDMFTINDPLNANHLKVYKVTRVETNSRYQSGTAQPLATERRIHFDPPLQRSTSDNSIVSFIDPKFRVISKGDLREYSLDLNNLYSFSLDVEEIQP